MRDLLSEPAIEPERLPLAEVAGDGGAKLN